MSYAVEIRNNATGEVRVYERDEDWEDPPCSYLWTEGNWGCDCNREHFFWEAGDDDDEPEPSGDGRCTDGRFTAIRAILPDGRSIKLDEPEEPRR